jgi:prepilin-type processing-associated H-X9-DG protein
MLLPMMARVRNMGKRISCMDNLRQQGICLNLYAVDNNGLYPSSSNIETPHIEDGIGTRYGSIGSGYFDPYVKTQEIYQCPAMNPPFKQYNFYSVNIWMHKVIDDRYVNPVEGTTNMPYLNQRTIKHPSLGVAYYDGGWGLRNDNNNSYSRYRSRTFTVFFPSSGPVTDDSTNEIGAGMTRHSLGANFVFFDGHSAYYRYPQYPRYLGRFCGLPYDKYCMFLK